MLGAIAAGITLAPRPRFLGAIPANRVVHTHSNHATSWNYSTGWYGAYVSQAVVDRMTDRGVMDLTGSDNYLKLAQTAGFGTFEHWDAQHYYAAIDYRRIEVDHAQYLPHIYRS